MPFSTNARTIPQAGTTCQLSVVNAAQQYLSAGLSVIPVRADGTKAPAVPSWREYQRERMTPEEADRVFRGGVGIAVVGGAVSGGLEVLDFDEPDLFEAWSMLVAASDDAYLLDLLPVAETPSGGRHCYYRTEATVPGSQKLALLEDGRTCRIETRGEGGYAIVAPSPADCHPDNRPYRLLQGDLTALPVLANSERDRLVSYCRAFDLTPPPATPLRAAQGRREATAPGGRPGDDYNRRTDWADVLEPVGWRQAGGHGGLLYWVRPGKQRGVSATTGLGVGDLLHVFTSSAAPFEPGQTLDKFGTFALLNHGGDFQAAARELGGRGFGDALPARAAAQPPRECPSDGTPKIPAGLTKALAGLPVTVEKLGLRVTAEIPPDDLKRGLRRLLRFQRETEVALRFMLGDLWNGLPGDYGTKKQWTKDNFSEGDYEQLNGYGWIAGGWTIERRRVGLPWSFFKVTASCSVAEQENYAARWGAEKLTIKKIEAEKAVASGTPAKSPIPAHWRDALARLSDECGAAYVEALLERELRRTRGSEFHSNNRSVEPVQRGPNAAPFSRPVEREDGIHVDTVPHLENGQNRAQLRVKI